MTDSYRTGLHAVVTAGGRVDNPGLVLDRYQRATRGDSPAMADHLKRVCDSAPSQFYRHAFDQWKETILTLDGVRAREFKAKSRLIVGLGAESVRETGITLLKLYGVPYIPGSALKGLAKRYAAAHPQPYPEWAEQVAVLFGDTEVASYLTFFDAWYVPLSATRDQPLLRDVITVHHQGYYNSADHNRPPWDLDDPNPVPFLCATGTYFVAVQGPDPKRAWAEDALNLIECALANWGIGGKTSSGYGRMTADGPLLPLAGQELLDRIAALTPEEARERKAARLRDLFAEAESLDNDAKARAYGAIQEKLIATTILPQLQREGHLWIRNLQAFLREHA